MPYSFFFSYAHLDNDSFLKRFHDELSNAVRQKGGETEGGRVSFLDQEEMFGTQWSPELVRAAQLSRVIVCVYSPSYFRSPDCGREWKLFDLRRELYVRQKREAGEAQAIPPPVILPVIWRQPPSPLPEPVAGVDPYLGGKDAVYNVKGMWTVTRLNNSKFEEEFVEFAELHSGVVSPHKGQLNPYYLGYKILEDIERRWDSPTAEEREKFGRKGGEGRAKLFEVREVENDVSLLRNYLTEELCEELDLFVYELVDEEEWTVTEKRWERVRDQLVANMTNFGFPYIVVADGDYGGNRELYLKHQYEGAELDMNYARKVLEHVHTLWGRPVHLETVVDDEPVRLHYNGEEHDED
jgi:SpoVR like protein/TIR domain